MKNNIQNIIGIFINQIVAKMSATEAVLALVTLSKRRTSVNSLKKVFVHLIINNY